MMLPDHHPKLQVHWHSKESGVSVWVHEESKSGTTRLKQHIESITVENQVLPASAAGVLKLSILRWLLAGFL